MAYTINLTNGQTLVPGGLSDGTYDQSHSSLTLIGRDFAGYGTFINENFVHLLENFAADAGPPNPLKGQLWWDTRNNILRVYSGTSWKVSTGATTAPHITPPSDLSTLGGDLWFDSTNSQLNVWSGTQWVVIGPAITPATGTTGMFPALMTSTGGSNYITAQLQINGIIYAIFSKDAFVTSLSGFSQIRPGINFSSVASPLWTLSNQDVLVTPNTLVQRDAQSGIAVNNITAQGIFAQSVAITQTGGAFTGNLSGNVTATTVTSGTVNATSITALNGFSGNLLTAAQPNLTSVGALTGLSVNGVTSLSGTATLNGAAIATISGTASFTSINNTPIGNLTPSFGGFTTITANTSIQAPAIGNVTPGTGAFTTLTTGGLQAKSIGNVTPGTAVFTTATATTVNAATIGNVGATLTGTIQTASQPNITGVGAISAGTWNGSIVQPTYGGTGVNNGSNTLTVSGSYTLNQRVDSGAAPTFTGTNFSAIPNAALSNNSITIGGTVVSLGGSYSLSSSAVTAITGTANQVTASAGTGSVTLSLPQNVHTGSNFQVNSLGVGAAPTATTGEIRATNNITAYYSDDRLKTRLGKIENALDKVDQLTGFYYEANETAQALGYEVKREVGLSAQDTNAVMPEIVAPAPIDDQYLTIRYEKFAPLLVEAIKELRVEINEIKAKLEQKA
jgi:hypothetical protein